MLKKIILLFVVICLVTSCAGRRYSSISSNSIKNNSNQKVTEDTPKQVPVINNTMCTVPPQMSNATTEFYGECVNGKAREGLVVWKENGIAKGLDCLRMDLSNYTNATGVDGSCRKYFRLLPSFCETEDYIGQCRDGKPNGIGVKHIQTTDGYSALHGQFLDGFPHGYVKTIRQPQDTVRVYTHAYWYVKGQQTVECSLENTVEECKARYEAEPARLAKEKREEQQREAKIQNFRKTIKEGDDTTNGVVIQVKGNLVKIQTNESQCTQRDYKDNCKNYVNTPAEKWFKRSEIYPSD